MHRFHDKYDIGIYSNLHIVFIFKICYTFINWFYLPIYIFLRRSLMKKLFNKKLITGSLTAALSLSLCTGLTFGVPLVKAAANTISGSSIISDVDYDGTWNGDYDNYNEKAERKNSTCIRLQQKGAVTLEKRLYLEGDIALPAELVEKVIEEKSRIDINGWLDYATNTPTDTEWYNEDTYIGGTEAFGSCTTVYSSTHYNTWQTIDGKDTDTNAELVKDGSYYIVHIKSAIEASPDITNFHATEIVYNFSVTAVNIKYDGFFICDNLKITNSQGKILTTTDIEDKTNFVGLNAYSNDQDVNSGYVTYNASSTKFQSAAAIEVTMDAQCKSDDTEESWRNTLATQHNISAKQILSSSVSIKKNTAYTASCTIYLPKASLDKAVIENGMMFNMYPVGATKIIQYDGWNDFDWDSVVNSQTLGETKIIKDASGQLKYFNTSWDKDYSNYKDEEAKNLPVYGSYYVLTVKTPFYFESSAACKGFEVNLNMSGDGCGFTGTVLADNFKITTSNSQIFYDDFDQNTQRNVYCNKADTTKPNKNEQGLVDWYDGCEAPSYFFAMDNSSSKITLNKSAVSIYTGKTATFKASVTGMSSDVSYKLSNSKIASITIKSNGSVVIKGTKKGTTYLYATANGITTKAKITVKAPTLTLKKTSAAVKKGKTVTIKATAAPSSKITYTSKNKKIATVSAKGVVKGIKKGKTTITVKANGITKSFKITVK